MCLSDRSVTSEAGAGGECVRVVREEQRLLEEAGEVEPVPPPQMSAEAPPQAPRDEYCFYPGITIQARVYVYVCVCVCAD